MTIDIIKRYLESEGSVCPYSARCQTLYLKDTQDARPALDVLPVNGALVIVGTEEWFTLIKGLNPSQTEFMEVKLWAYSIFLCLYGNALQVTRPDITHAQVRTIIKDDVVPLIGNNTLRPMIVLKDHPLITFCMAPVYPRSHPRYAPTPIVAVNRLTDVKATGQLPKVREVMKVQHGHVYDACELVLPLPSHGD